jgi:hypothetical protein
MNNNLNSQYKKISELEHKIIINDTVSIAITKYDTFKRKSTFSTWMWGIYRHKLYEYLRKLKKIQLDIEINENSMVIDEKLVDEGFDYKKNCQGKISIIFRKIGTKAALGCEKTFFQLYNSFKGNRHKMAIATERTDDSIKKQISRCNELLREQVIEVLIAMKSDSACECATLLMHLYWGRTLSGMRRQGLNQRLEELSIEYNTTIDSLARRVKVCRQLAFSKI